jgi:ParB-like chromosome segregation protein Spo0J
MVKRGRKDTKSDRGRVRVDRVLTLPVHDDLDQDVVNSIAESFPLAGGGLINPITVRRVREQEGGEEVVKTVLVAGAHRLEAARRAGMKRIDCTFIEGDETEARIVQIEENLFRNDLTVLQRAELLAEWAELALTKGYISGQHGRKSKLGRPQGGFSKLARKLPTVGRSFEARRKIIVRATKIAGISAAAKDSAKDVGLDDNQKALLKIAKAGSRKAQVKKAKELGARLWEAIKVTGSGADSSSLVSRGNNQKAGVNGAVESPPLQPGSDSKAKESADTEDSDDENAGKVPKDTTLDELEARWKQTGGPKLWKHTPFVVRKEFTEMLLRARCAAKVDVAAFVRDVFSGRKEIYIPELNCFAKTKGISKKALNSHLRFSGYRRKKRGSQPGAPWVRLNNDRYWKDHPKTVSDADLEAPLATERKLEAEAEGKFARDSADDDYYNF